MWRETRFLEPEEVPGERRIVGNQQAIQRRRRAQVVNTCRGAVRAESLGSRHTFRVRQRHKPLAPGAQLPFDLRQSGAEGVAVTLDLLLERNPRRTDVRVPHDPMGQGPFAFERIVVELQRLAQAGQIVEVAGGLRGLDLPISEVRPIVEINDNFARIALFTHRHRGTIAQAWPSHQPAHYPPRRALLLSDHGFGLCGAGDYL